MKFLTVKKISNKVPSEEECDPASVAGQAATMLN
jgi:hypothetical protein